MDACGDHLWQSIPDDRFVVQDSSYTLVEIRRPLAGNDPVSFEKSTIARSSLHDWARNAALSQTTDGKVASFQCLVISTHEFNDFPVDISRNDLLSVTNNFNIPPIQAQLLFAPYTGYAGFDRQVRWSSGRPGLRAISSTNPDIARTFAIVTVNESEQTSFEEDLRRCSHIADHPLMLAFVVRVNTLKLVQSLTQGYIASLRDAERMTGFHAEHEEDPGQKNSSHGHNIPEYDFGQLSKKVASDASNLGNMKMILARLISMDEMLRGDHGRLKWQEFYDSSSSVPYMSRVREIKETDIVFESMRLSLHETVIEYQSRARNLQSVLFNLIAKEDTDASIQLARDSRTIAVATKKDGESMKTIAIMTMLFLPGTFFSALFAVPTLQWNESPVVQNKFWVYWAFTIPSTIVIFMAWYIIILSKRNSKQTPEAAENASKSTDRWSVPRPALPSTMNIRQLVHAQTDEKTYTSKC